MQITTRTRIGWAYTTNPQAAGYGTDAQMAKAQAACLADADAVGTVRTIGARIKRRLRDAGLSSHLTSTYYYSTYLIREGGAWRKASIEESQAIYTLKDTSGTGS